MYHWWKELYNEVTSMEVSLMEMLDARERRAQRQMQLLQQSMVHVQQ